MPTLPWRAVVATGAAIALSAGGVALAIPAVTPVVTAGRAAPTAAACPAGLSVSAQLDPAGGRPVTVCSGLLPSFDGTPLSTSVSIPDGRHGPLPLVVMLHGWGNSKANFMSTTLAGNGTYSYDWNNAWFASQGYAVLNYTARGFSRSCGQNSSAGYTYLLDPACAGRASWTHLADRRWEIHDTQYLTGLLVDAGIANPNQVVVTGDSYGGGQSWLLALSQNKVMQPDGSLVDWTSPKGVPIHLAAAVPQFGWTDLAQALVDNGRASDGLNGAPADAAHENPPGVAKQTYIAGLYALGQTTAQYAGPNDPTADLPGWFAAINAGNPYRADPLVLQALSQLQQYRSAFSLPVPGPGERVPIFTLQGVTDPLFPAIQSTQEIRKLTAADPNYPVWAFFGDIGHSYADNPHATWVAANGEANRWLGQVLTHRPVTEPRITATTVACESGQSVATYTAPGLAALATGIWTLRGTGAQPTTSLAAGGPESVAVDPIVNSGCRTISTQTDPGVAAWTFRPPAGPAAVLLGAPVVHVAVTPVGAGEELAARLWDVAPGGTQTLITRSIYRITTAPGTTQTIAFELWPTAWQLLPGHQLKLELTQGDSPTWRVDNLASALLLGPPTLTVPVRPAG